ncbi:two component transcriptional regulator, LuxR family [Dyella sp. OK004]|uniref:response regulator transcription factor n=1 Tax=Dyella sp. OK004 TaxID=1855292 RepID=UPI0008EE3931|nr:response regulator transcription factor [Dyella sp. OK004]SFS20023.1 two component transcriptional regulator, LuxR family [Dyella sp. OK004]
MAAGSVVVTGAKRLRIALADDQALVLCGLKALLGGFEQLEVVIEADSGEALLEQMTKTTVDVVLSDIRMPGLDGFGLCERLRRLPKSPPVILLTTFNDPDMALRAAEGGADGFLLKDASPMELVATIEEVASGRTVIAPISTDLLRTRYAYHDDNAPSGRFNKREVDILRLLAGGYTNREIGQAIHIAEGTVKNYLIDIFDKLDTRDRTRAVLKAITLKII